MKSSGLPFSSVSGEHHWYRAGCSTISRRIVFSVRWTSPSLLSNPLVSPYSSVSDEHHRHYRQIQKSLRSLSLSDEHHQCYRQIHQSLPYQCQMNITNVIVKSTSLPVLISVRWTPLSLSSNPKVSPFLIIVRWASPMLSWNPPVSPSNEHHDCYSGTLQSVPPHQCQMKITIVVKSTISLSADFL